MELEEIEMIDWSLADNNDDKNIRLFLRLLEIGGWLMDAIFINNYIYVYLM